MLLEKELFIFYLAIIHVQTFRTNERKKNLQKSPKVFQFDVNRVLTNNNV